MLPGHFIRFSIARFTHWCGWWRYTGCAGESNQAIFSQHTQGLDAVGGAARTDGEAIDDALDSLLGGGGGLGGSGGGGSSGGRALFTFREFPWDAHEIGFECQREVRRPAPFGLCSLLSPQPAFAEPGFAAHLWQL